MQYKCIICGKDFISSPCRKKQTCSRQCGGKLKSRIYLKEKHWNWKGGKYIDTDGYIRVYNPNHPYAMSDGYVREHRLVMEQKLGRYLMPLEDVHHINRNKQDNRVENLELIPHYKHSSKTNKNRIFTEEHKKKLSIAAQHKKNCKLYTFQNQSHTLKEWSKILNIKRNTLYRRIIITKWPTEKAFTTPIKL